MTPRDQLTLGGDGAANDSDNPFEGATRAPRLDPGARALALVAGDDGASVAARLAARRGKIQRGRAAQRAGAAWERWLEAEHQAAQDAGGLAWWVHAHAEAKYVRTVGGKRELRHVARAAADYVLLTKVGSVVVVEAKHVSPVARAKGPVADRLGLEDVPQQQRDHLTATAKAGGVALLAVEYALPGRVAGVARYAVPWLEVPWQVGGRGGWSVGHEALNGYEAVDTARAGRRLYYWSRWVA